MRNSRTLGLALAAVLAAGTLSACGSDDAPTEDAVTATPSEAVPTGDADSTGLPDGVTAGLPEGVEAPQDASAGAGWSEDGTGLWVVTFGSSTNPTVATLESADAGTVTLALAPVVPDGPGTMDYVPTTTVLDLPEEVDSGAPVEVVLGDLGSVMVTGPGAPAWVVPDGA